jgi:hypothetical protein
MYNTSGPARFDFDFDHKQWKNKAGLELASLLVEEINKVNGKSKI